MKLFSSKIFEAIKEGQITLAFRLWDSCRLVPGKSYSIGKLGRIIIKSAEKTPLSAITDNDARLAGFDNVAQLWDELKTQKPGLDINGAACFRIEFHYDGVNRDSNPIRAPRPLPPAAAAPRRARRSRRCTAAIRRPNPRRRRSRPRQASPPGTKSGYWPRNKR